MNKVGVESGKVKFYNREKAFGFIKCDDESELFFHVTGCKDGYQPKQEDRVEFIIGSGKRGAMAQEVSPVE